MDQYPPNSQRAAGSARKPEEFEQVTTSEVIRKKKSIWKQFRHTFIGGDAKTAVNYVFLTVLLPAFKDMLVDAGAQGMEKLVYGDSSRRPRRGPTSSYGQLGHVAYNRMSQATQPRTMSPRARQTHDFDEIVLASRVEATDVLDQMIEIVSKFEVVTVSDLYSLTGLTGTHVDNKWGWTDLRGATVRRLRNEGYLLDLPVPEYLND